MIPEFEVEIGYDYELVELRTDLTAEDVAAGFVEHHDYECLGLPSWEEAAECLAREAEILEQAARSSAPDGIDTILVAVQEEDDVGFAELMSEFRWNDVGVAGVSLALSAARTATFYSCASGLGHHHAKYPTVGVVPDAERAALLAELAERAGCGIGQQRGRWYLYARSVTAFHALGQSILKHREAFDTLPQPGWADGLEEELERINDF
ncbi:MULTISPECIES: hypothetical protein [Streptomyces]|uniref:hypothetical protein n=1 Tax=Streptomyces TaxID=1883 RepID=UPI001912BA9F|nr:MULTISPECIES: hypothetical protein [Streptomyces]MBK5990421.1 hypothetical protein [Streptomyces sp. MBT58]WSR92220.1 hypothetical protein OG728_18220 [Streptomyces microflavus]